MYHFLLVFVFFSLTLKAQINPSTEASRLQQQQQEFERSIKEQQLQKQRQLDQFHDKKATKRQSQRLDTFKTNQACFKLNNIFFEGEHRLSKRRQKKLTVPFLNRCLTPELLKIMIERVNNDYIRRGYSTTRVYLQSQNIRMGELSILVIPGKLEKIRLDSLDGDGFFTKTKIWTAFGRPYDKILNLRDLEQGVEQFNRLSSYRTNIKILPSVGKPSYSIVQVVRQKQTRSTRVRISGNNSGQRQTGLYNGKLILEQDNLLQLNEVFYATFTHDLSFNTDSKYARNFYFNLTIPLHWWTISSSYVQSFYLNTIPTTNSTFVASGESSFATYKIQRNLYRNQVEKLAFSFDIALKNTVSFIEDVKNEVGSRSLSVATLGLNHTLNAPWGYLNSTLSFVAGLKCFDAHEDVGPFDDFTPRAQYTQSI